MTEDALVKSILTTSLPVECDLVGDINVNIAIQNRHKEYSPEISRTEGGANIDLSEAISIIFAAATLSLEIYAFYKLSQEEKSNEPHINVKDSDNNKIIIIINKNEKVFNTTLEAEVVEDLVHGIKEVANSDSDSTILGDD